MAELAQTTLRTESVQSFMKSKGFVSVAKNVRENKNNLPYVTFVKENNEAENVYFSKTTSAAVAAGTPIVKGFFDAYAIGYPTNADGEERTKLVSVSRLDVADLF